MKILHVTKKYPNVTGGDSSVVANLERYQEKIGHEVYILTSNCDEIKESLRVIKFALKIGVLSIDRINLNRVISLIILFFNSFFYLRKIKPDIVHSHSPELGFILSFACRVYKIPIINTCHGVTFPDKNYSYIKRKLEEFFLKYAYFRNIITVDRSSLDGFRKLRIKNVKYLPNGIDLDLFQRKRNNINRKTIFLFVGRLELAKGLEYLIHAVNNLIKIENNFEVLLIGNGIDQKFFQDLVIRFDLIDYVKFLGKKDQDRVIDYYYSSDVFILPSLHEGFPITLLEAWAAELPVIVTDVGGISAICSDSENALIIPPQNVDEISNTMFTLIKNKKLRRKLGCKGRTLVKEKFNWEKIVRTYENVYMEAIEK